MNYYDFYKQITDFYKQITDLTSQIKKLTEVESPVKSVKKDTGGTFSSSCINVTNNYISNKNTHTHISNNTNISVNIEIRPVTKLSLDHISPEKMKEVIEKYNLDKSKLNYLLTDYLNNVLCDSLHPENHAVKYIKRYPPTFNSVTEDSEGNIITVIKGLNDSCELLSDPVLDVLKKKLHECIIKYKEGDCHPECIKDCTFGSTGTSGTNDYDYSLYNNAIKELRKELRKDKIKKVLTNFLKNDLINNIEMKLKIKCDAKN